jgi:hypothetical protein
LGGWAAAKIMGAVRAAAVVSILGLTMLIAGSGAIDGLPRAHPQSRKPDQRRRAETCQRSLGCAAAPQ